MFLINLFWSLIRLERGRIFRVGINVKPFSSKFKSSKVGEKVERLMVENCFIETAVPVWGECPSSIKNGL